jgi:hypothetical protein
MNLLRLLAFARSPVPLRAPLIQPALLSDRSAQGYAGGKRAATVTSGQREALAKTAVMMETAGVAQGLAARHVFADVNILVRGSGEEDIVSLPRTDFTPVGQKAPASS